MVTRTSHRAAVLAVGGLLAMTACASCSSGSSDDASGSSDVVVTATTATARTDASAPPVAPPGVGDDPAKDNRPPTQDEIDTSAGMPSVCLMVTVDDVSAATGVTAVSSHEGVSGQTTTCFVDDAAGEKLVAVAASPAARFDEAATAADAREVTGLGDAAVWSDGRLHVLVGEEELSFRLYPAAGVADADVEPVLEQLAATTVSRSVPPPPTTD